MYGVLHIDGTYHDLPEVEAASLEGDQLVCYDAEDREVARFSSAAVFWQAEMLRRIASLLSAVRIEAPPIDAVP
jgi:hypothetical protein